MNDDLRHHGVIKGRYHLALTPRGNNVDGRIVGHYPFSDLAGVGAENQTVTHLGNLLCVQTDLNGITVVTHLEIFDRCAAGDAELLGDDVYAAHLFRHRMLNLQAGIHLHEVNGVVHHVEDEFDGAGPNVIHLMSERQGAFPHLRLKLRRERGGTGFLYHLLLVPLDGAISDTQYEPVTVMVTKQLRFDVAHGGHELLEVHIAITKGVPGLRLHLMEEIMERLWRFNDLDTLTAAAVNSLNEHRITNVLGHLRGPLDASQNPVGAGHHGDPKAPRRTDCIGLIAHGFHGGHRRPNEVNAVVAA